MFADLHEGILEIFAEAQGRTMSLDEALERWGARRRERQREGKREHSRRVRLEIRAIRARRRQQATPLLQPPPPMPMLPAWRPARPRVEVVTCERCGAQAERREGCRALTAHQCLTRQAAQNSAATGAG